MSGPSALLQRRRTVYSAMTSRLFRRRLRTEADGLRYAIKRKRLHVAGEAVLEHERRALALDLIMDADSPVVGVRHGVFLPYGVALVGGAV